MTKIQEICHTKCLQKEAKGMLSNADVNCKLAQAAWKPVSVLFKDKHMHTSRLGVSLKCVANRNKICVD